MPPHRAFCGLPDVVPGTCHLRLSPVEEILRTMVGELLYKYQASDFTNNQVYEQGVGRTRDMAVPTSLKITGELLYK